MRNALRVTAAVLFGVVLFVAAGCGGGGGTTTSGGGATTSSASSGTTAPSVSTAPSATTAVPGPATTGVSVPTTTAAPVSLPDGFPTDVPLYTQGTMIDATVRPSDTSTTYRVTMRSPDDGSTIFAWYKDALTRDGWTMNAAVDGGQDSRLNATKASEAITVQTGNSTDGVDKTVVAITVLKTH